MSNGENANGENANGPGAPAGAGEKKARKLPGRRTMKLRSNVTPQQKKEEADRKVVEKARANFIAQTKKTRRIALAEKRKIEGMKKVQVVEENGLNAKGNNSNGGLAALLRGVSLGGSQGNVARLGSIVGAAAAVGAAAGGAAAGAGGSGGGAFSMGGLLQSLTHKENTVNGNTNDEEMGGGRRRRAKKTKRRAHKKRRQTKRR